MTSTRQADRNQTEHPDESPFERLAGEYDAWFDGKGKLIFRTELSAFRELLRSLPKPWIEIGVGSGRFAQALGISRGVEPSVQLGRMAELRGIEVIRSRGEDVAVPEASFGTVFIIVTLCFVDDPRSVLRRAREALQDRGKLVLGLIVSESPWAKSYRAKKEAHPFYSIAHFYGYDEVLQFLRDAGFRHERTLSTLFQKPGEVAAVETPREGFSPDAGFLIIAAGKSEMTE